MPVFEPPDPNAVPPLDFAALGLEQEEKKARRKLRKELQRIFDTLSRAELAEPKAYLKLLPPVICYAQSLVDALAGIPTTEPANVRQGRSRLQNFLGELEYHIAPFPSKKIHLDESYFPLDAKKISAETPPLTRARFYKALRAATPWHLTEERSSIDEVGDVSFWQYEGTDYSA